MVTHFPFFPIVPWQILKFFYENPFICFVCFSSNVANRETRRKIDGPMNCDEKQTKMKNMTLTIGESNQTRLISVSPEISEIRKLDVLTNSGLTPKSTLTHACTYIYSVRSKHELSNLTVKPPNSHTLFFCETLAWPLLDAFFINLFWPSDAIQRHKTGSTLVRVIACCPTAASYCLNQRWLIICEFHWEKFHTRYLSHQSLTLQDRCWTPTNPRPHYIH